MSYFGQVTTNDHSFFLHWRHVNGYVSNVVTSRIVRSYIHGTVGWGMDISQKYVFSDMYDITCSESREDMQFNAKKVISIALLLQKWDVFEHRRFSDYAVLFGTGLYCGIRMYGLHKKLLKFACLRSFFHSTLVSP